MKMLAKAAETIERVDAAAESAAESLNSQTVLNYALTVAVCFAVIVLAAAVIRADL